MVSSKSMKRVTHSEDWWATAPPHILRCTAHYKADGLQCRREAHPGTNVCKTHGALAPAVQGAAATRIQMSVDEAAKRLVDWMNDSGVDMRERVRIAHDLLDRGGLAATSKHLIGVITEDPIEKLFRSIAADPNGTYDPATVQVHALPAADSAQEAMNAAADGSDWDCVPGRQAGTSHVEDVVDAEVIEDETPTTHTVHSTESTSSRPPRHIREAMESLL